MYRQLFQEFDKIDSERNKKEEEVVVVNGNGAAGGKEEEVVEKGRNGGGAVTVVGEEDVQPDLLPDPCGPTCPFCNSEIENEDLDKHYWKSCPLLTKCPQCSLVLEIGAFSAHLISVFN